MLTQVDLAEHPVEQGPYPGDEGRLDAVREKHRYEPHRAGNVEAAGAVRGADYVPGQGPASEEVCTEVLRGPFGQQPAESNDCEKITSYDENVDGVQLQLHLDSFLLGRARQHVVYKLIEAARGQTHVLVRRAVVHEQRAVNHDLAAREDTAAVVSIDFVILLGLHDPVGRAVQNCARVFEVQQQCSEAVIFVGTDSVVNGQPAVPGFYGRGIDADLYHSWILDGAGIETVGAGAKSGLIAGTFE